MDIYFKDDPAIKNLAKEITEWKFIASGEGSQSQYHEWRCAFYLGHSVNKKIYAIQIVDLSDDEETNETFKEIVVIIKTPTILDENYIVNKLLKYNSDNGGKFIDIYYDVGNFQLNR